MAGFEVQRPMASTKVTLQLSNDEALVFFDWIKRFNESTASFADQAEERVLWDLEAILEKQMVEAFSDDYEQLLVAARNRVRDATE